MRTLLVIFLNLIVAQAFATSIYLDNATEFVHAGHHNVQPGDTIYVHAGSRGMINLVNFKGTAQAPIVIINYGGLVEINSLTNDGIKLNGCEHLIISGAGDSSITYGFDITARDMGIHAFNLSTDIEIHHVEIQESCVGIMYKSGGVLRNTFVQYNTKIHNNYIHNTVTEGIYVGSSYYTSGNDHLLNGVDIYMNKIDSTGWDAIQVGSATANCNVRYNEISHDSQSQKPSQMSGIMINPGSNCDCFGNTIVDGEGPGIFDQGIGTNKIYNNLIVRPGINGNYQQPRGLDGISIYGINRNYSAGNSIEVYNNTIIEPKNNGITFAYDENIQGNQSVIANNIIYKPNGLYYYTWIPDEAYVETMRNPVYTTSNNIFTDDLNDILFFNYAGDDFRLSASSPAINNGMDLSGHFTLDITQYTRQNFDIDAFEWN